MHSASDTTVWGAEVAFFSGRPQLNPPALYHVYMLQVRELCRTVNKVQSAAAGQRR